jgi:hypothetical protein
MKYQALARFAAVALGAALAVGVTAQTQPETDRIESPPGTVMTDVAPLPAEDRSSTGAIVLHNSLVRAQRDNAFNASGERTGISSVARSATRVLTGRQAEADLADARQNEANDLKRMGAGALEKR